MDKCWKCCDSCGWKRPNDPLLVYSICDAPVPQCMCEDGISGTTVKYAVGPFDGKGCPCWKEKEPKSKDKTSGPWRPPLMSTAPKDGRTVPVWYGGSETGGYAFYCQNRCRWTSIYKWVTEEPTHWYPADPKEWDNG